MKRWIATLFTIAVALGLAAQTRSVTCLVMVEEGASSEANSLFLRKMFLDPAALQHFAPAAFTFSGGRLKLEAEGTFGYTAATPRLVERKGAMALYEVKAEIRAPAPPRAWKTAVVELRTADLAVGADLGFKAIEFAARKLRLSGGRAWIVDMGLKSPGLIRAKVAFAR